MKYYCGVGSRSTPEESRELITSIAKFLQSQGYTLRSGGAEGADTFFEKGAGQLKQIFLPWRGFNDNESQFYQSTTEAFAMAEEFHPTWDHLSTGARKLMARNSHQVLGPDLDDPVDFVLYWSNSDHGGTQQVLRVAEDRDIPIFNVNIKEEIDEFKEFFNRKFR